MRIAICDDEKSCCEAIESAVRHWSDRNTHDISTHVYFSSEEMLLAYEERQYDVVFLDIQFPGEISGYELASRLRASDEWLQIVFTTNFSDYAIQGYSVNALRYLLKPVQEEQIFECLDIAHRQYRLSQDKMLILSTKNAQHALQQRDILFLESKGHTLYIHSRGVSDPIQIRATLEHIHGRLSKELFVRCHKSYVVNISCVRKLTYESATIGDGQTIPVGIRYKNAVYQAFEEYFQGR